MSTVVRAIPQQSIARDSVATRSEALILPLPDVKMLVLLSLILLSAVALVFVKDLNRRLFVNYQKELATYQQLRLDDNKLQLERSARSSQSRVWLLAERSAMQIPGTSDVVVLQQKAAK